MTDGKPMDISSRIIESLFGRDPMACHLALRTVLAFDPRLCWRSNGQDPFLFGINAYGWDHLRLVSVISVAPRRPDPQAIINPETEGRASAI